MLPRPLYQISVAGVALRAFVCLRTRRSMHCAEAADVINGQPGNNITDNIFSKIGMVRAGPFTSGLTLHPDLACPLTAAIFTR